MDYQTIIGNNLPYFITSNIFIDALRVLGWWIIKALANLSEVCEVVLMKLTIRLILPDHKHTKLLYQVFQF